jgi:hypothetical protein
MRIKSLRVLDLNICSGAGPLKKLERLSVRQKPQAPAEPEFYYQWRKPSPSGQDSFI